MNPDGRLARLRIGLTYLWRHGRLPRLRDPQRFTEWVQHAKLHCRNPRLPALIDKVAVKRHVAELLGEEWVTPLLWSGTALPPSALWPEPYVIKSRHGCNQRIFVRGVARDWAQIRRRAARWVQRPYGLWLDEWGYRDVPRGIIVEAFAGDGPGLPIDYKLYVFGGRVEAVQVHVDRETAHRWMLFDRDWHWLSTPQPAKPAAPASLLEMIAAAERLATGMPFVRVDFFEIDGRPRFGEMTFYPGSGLDPFDPDALDLTLGAHWARVTEQSSARPEAAPAIA